jgi:hypothetical protein
MDVITTIFLGIIGFLIGNLLFSKVGMWIATIYEIAKDPGKDSKGARLASATFLSSGPWFLLVTGVFAAFVHSKSWATPILVGGAMAIVFFSIFAVYLARKARARREDAA